MKFAITVSPLKQKPFSEINSLQHDILRSDIDEWPLQLNGNETWNWINAKFTYFRKLFDKLNPIFVIKA